MAPRANWKGYLRLSLVSRPIALFPATAASERVRFHQINRKTGHASACAGSTRERASRCPTRIS